jgi:26S proteasome regulatory subunit N1
MRTGAVLGLGLAYAGSNRSDVIVHLLKVFADQKSNMEIVGVAALALGLIAVGSCNNDVTTTLLQTLMEKSEADLKDPFAKFLPLGIGLCYLAKQDACEATLATLEVCSGFSIRVHPGAQKHGHSLFSGYYVVMTALLCA